MPEPRPVQWRVMRYDSLESTNAMALGCGHDGMVVVAERQTAGHGRHGRAWESRPGLGLWFSVALAQPALGLPMAAGLAVREAVGPRVRLEAKWPNDLLAGGRKVCGVLAEHRAGWSALGIGLNVLHTETDFSDALRGAAGSLAMAGGGVWDREALLEATLAALAPRVLALRAGRVDEVAAAWYAALDLHGRPWRRGAVEGVVCGMERDGALAVETAQGRVVLRDSDPAAEPPRAPARN